nr:VWA domain-containing protein [Oscillochloris trichoides]
MLLRSPQLLWLLLLLPSVVLFWRWRGLRVGVSVLALRLGSVALLVLALADPVLGVEAAADGPLIVLVDQSDSLGPTGQALARQRADEVLRSVPGEVRLLFFGAQVVAEGSDTPLDPAASDLATALRTASALLPNGGRIWLFSDGVQTRGDALAEARRLANAGITLDAFPVAAAQQPDAAIIGVEVPRLLRPDEEFPLVVTLRYAPGDAATSLPAHLRLWVDGRLIGDQEVVLNPGDTQFTFRQRAAAPGILQVQAELSITTGDTFIANNRGGATATVVPPPTILIVANQPELGGWLAQILEREGLHTSQIVPERMPSRISDMAAYDGMILLDVPATALSLDQMATVREFVRSEGRGLLAMGGHTSFTLGSYQNTPLADVLPVLMEPPPRPQRSDVALLLIMDRSASMLASFGVSKFDMAKEAAQLATESLQPEDRIGLLAFDTETLWVVPFQLISGGLSVAQIQEQIASLPSGGGTRIERALEVGLPALAEQPTKVRHAVLLTDGRSFMNDNALYQRLVETARSQQITLSTIAIGLDSDTALLKQLAAWGGGRYYYADQPADIPRLTLLESKIAGSDPAVEQALRAELTQSHPLMRDIAPADLPELGGYVAVTQRPQSEVVLHSPDADPLLAAWQYGLGRAVAWLPGLDPAWMRQWQSWGGTSRFLAQLVRYTLPDPESGLVQVRLDPQPGGATLIVDAAQPGGNPINLATVNALITLPDGTTRNVDLRQSAPGRYRQDLLLPSPGAYRVAVVVVHDGQRQEQSIGYVQPIAEEYQLGTTPSDGMPLLQALAAASGGQLSPVVVGETQPTPVGAGVFNLWPLLVSLALLLWVVEIALRRGFLPNLFLTPRR